MFNERAFRALALIKGVSMDEIASKLGINKSTLYRKMSGESDFYRAEIQTLIGYLGIENPSEIFFCSADCVNAN